MNNSYDITFQLLRNGFRRFEKDPDFHHFMLAVSDVATGGNMPSTDYFLPTCLPREGGHEDDENQNDEARLLRLIPDGLDGGEDVEQVKPAAHVRAQKENSLSSKAATTLSPISQNRRRLVEVEGDKASSASQGKGFRTLLLVAEITDAARAQNRLTAITTSNDALSATKQSLWPEAGHNRTRKGHKKSRRGCFQCKAKKIKCQENQPACQNCLRKNQECKYPAAAMMAAATAVTPPSPGSLTRGSASTHSPMGDPQAAAHLQATPMIFNLADMRLFHHFLFHAYPHLPVGNDVVWTLSVPQISHHNPYLMHAVLGLAASHLYLMSPVDWPELQTTALQHRLHAIRGANTAISQANRRAADGDALLAALFALIFQASYMPDAMVEFFQMIRGCMLVTQQLEREGLHLAFSSREPGRDHFAHMQTRLVGLPMIDPTLVNGAERSLQLCAATLDLGEIPVCRDFLDLLLDLMLAMRASSLFAYFKFIAIYQSFHKMSTSAFLTLLDPANQAGRVLLAHFLALRIVLAPILEREWDVVARREPPLRSLVAWILEIEGSLARCQTGARQSSVESLLLGSKSGAARDMLSTPKDFLYPSANEPESTTTSMPSAAMVAWPVSIANGLSMADSGLVGVI